MLAQPRKPFGGISHNFPAPLNVSRLGLPKAYNFAGLRADQRVDGWRAPGRAVKREITVPADGDDLLKRERE